MKFLAEGVSAVAMGSLVFDTAQSLWLHFEQLLCRNEKGPRVTNDACSHTTGDIMGLLATQLTRMVANASTCPSDGQIAFFLDCFAGVRREYLLNGSVRYMRKVLLFNFVLYFSVMFVMTANNYCIRIAP